MYRNLENLEIIKGDDKVAENYIRKNPHLMARHIGFGGLDSRSPHSLDKQFYEMAGISFDNKYTSFKSLPRDAQKEDELFSKLTPQESPYIFCHDDSSRNMTINLSHDLPMIKADPIYTSCIFDYCKIIENATEIHVFDSSFFFLVDCLDYKNSNQSLYSHRYLRQHLFSSQIEIPHHQKDWNILTEKPQ
tara:strand:+ start:347 stop:916 length:570 start_codon:yes stop_codon:yes gene_type:complete